MRPFANKGLRAEGSVLSLCDFRLFSDMKSPTYNEKNLNRVVKEAESYLDKPLEVMPASVYRQFFTVGNRSNFEALYFKRRDMAVRLALAEAYEKKGRFTEKLMDAVWAIMEESTWIIPAHLRHNQYGSSFSLPPVYSEKYDHGIDLFAAATAGALATVYYVAKDALDGIEPMICKKMKHLLHERIVRPYVECTFSWSGEAKNRTNNWCPWIVSNVLYVTALTEEDIFNRTRVVSKAMFHLDNFVDWYEPDGGCDEGPAYWSAAGASLFDSLELIEDMSGGKLSVYDNEVVKNIGEYIFKVNIDGHKFVNFADCAPTTAPNPQMLIRFGEKCKSPFLVAFGKKQSAFGNYICHPSHMYRTLKGLCTPDVAAESCPMSTCTYLPNLKVMTARESTDSSMGMFLAIKGGNNGEMHNHNDVGNFIVYYNGKPVIIDTGVGQYTKQTFSPQRYELWFMQSGYHNLPSFGGVDQKDGARFASSDEVFVEDKKSLQVQLKDAYPKDAGILSFVRTSALTGGRVTVSDKFNLSEEKQVCMHLMTATAPVMQDETHVQLAEGRILTVSPKLNVEIEEFDPVGMDTKRIWGTEKLWRINLTLTAKEGEYTISVE